MVCKSPIPESIPASTKLGVVIKACGISLFFSISTTWGCKILAVPLQAITGSMTIFSILLVLSNLLIVAAFSSLPNMPVFKAVIWPPHVALANCF